MPLHTKVAPERGMLNRWAAKIDERRMITAFWDWLEDHPAYSGLSRFEIDLEKALNEYHEIDAKQLEKERRALLDQNRNLNPT